MEAIKNIKNKTNRQLRALESLHAPWNKDTTFDHDINIHRAAYAELQVRRNSN